MRIVTGMVLASVATIATATAHAQPQPAADRDSIVAAIAADAYVYGYPLVTMSIARRIATNVSRPQGNGFAPVNQFGHVLEFPTAPARDVTAPLVNTLSSFAWLDLSEPIVIHVPDTGGRYYFLEVFDFWTNAVASIGKRTTGTKAQNVALIGPAWKGVIPAGVDTTYRSATNTVRVVLRIQTNGPADYAAVNAIQRGIRTTPFSAYGKPFSWLAGRESNPTIDMKTPVTTQVGDLLVEDFFNILAGLLATNLPATHDDSAVVTRMAPIGIEPGKDFVPTKFDSATWNAIKLGAAAGRTKITAHARTLGRSQNGWRSLALCGEYGTDYLTRAAVAMLEPECNIPQDVLYPTAFVDADRRQLNGAHRYVLRFPPGQTPPVDGFWAVTMNDVDRHLVPNALNRYAVRSWNDLRKNADGSVDLYIQRDSPGAAKEANWLPAPLRGGFVLTMELYWPKASALDGSWTPPGVRRSP